MSKPTYQRAQVDLLQEKILDSFAGGGGASTGIELATGRTVDFAINHDSAAILMHKTNHPYTEHFQASVWDVWPDEVLHGSKLGLAWFSPDCKHFSKAKGGKPVDKHIRGLAWIVLRWAGIARPRVIILENVEEFQTWGPVRRGKPVKSKQGQTFRKFIAQLRALGYDVEWRELVAADYGAPTTRKRFFLIARCDGQPIVWPEPTHAPADSEDVKAGRKKPWRSAAEIIDWTLPCPSIFDSREEIKAKYGLTAQRPLRPNTMRRVARGIDKFVIKSTHPFLVHCKFDNAPEPVSVPLRTITSVNSHLLACPALIQYHTEQTECVRGQAVTDPVMTIDASNRYGLAAATLTKYYSGPDQAQDVGQPMHTITTKPREGVTLAHLVKMKGDNVGGPVTEPVQTITAGGCHHGLVVTRIEKAEPGADLQRWPQIRELLNTYCGYHLADDDVILFQIGGAWYFMADIGLRMLVAPELYCANGFPPDYIIDRDYLGNAYPKSEQVARCGNAVPPPFATALVRANLPEWCDREITTMAELEQAVAV